METSRVDGLRDSFFKGVLDFVSGVARPFRGREKGPEFFIGSCVFVNAIFEFRDVGKM